MLLAITLLSISLVANNYDSTEIGSPTASPPQNIVDSPFEVLWKFDTGG